MTAKFKAAAPAKKKVYLRCELRPGSDVNPASGNGTYHGRVWLSYDGSLEGEANILTSLATIVVQIGNISHNGLVTLN